ncbi:hypothetical protein FE374_06020 [Georgenia yuyongxinii]|uniref:Uncharacterized protein n=1 Tax=Georgenia yuyongxinii TaxID=2589797 RepID=A0A5B8C0J3_9MICO|nr:hypothetical protein [Georgenia yuyongxinii]QDC24239.1 hypothetical protein FE374_06020 [Georgenia yuyongxinii]
MTGAMLAMVGAALCAVVVLLLVLGERRPDGGWYAWLRDSVQAWRSDELAAAKLQPQGSAVRDTPLEDLFSLGAARDQPAYARPEELRDRLDQARQQARSLARR